MRQAREGFAEELLLSEDEDRRVARAFAERGRRASGFASSDFPKDPRRVEREGNRRRDERRD
jgi:hypothetical protein